MASKEGDGKSQQTLKFKRATGYPVEDRMIRPGETAKIVPFWAAIFIERGDAEKAAETKGKDEKK